jgi:adenosylmethionine-8-amino-7-oxononanoate aminotransferase
VNLPIPFDVRAADRAHVWHPYTQHGIAVAAVPISHARGAYLYTDAGAPVFDAISSWWVTLHGHAEPRIADAIARQAATLEQVIFAGYTHEPAARLASELVRRLPAGLTRVFYSDDGSTAVEAAIKMAIQYWHNAGQERRTVVALDRAYHGDTFGAMSVGARGLFTDPFARQLFDVVRLPDPSRDDPAGALRAVLEDRDDVAAIVVEPMLLGAGGMRIWSADALRRMRELSLEHEVLLIADEVLTGFGRTGPLFACEHAGITPDLICLSKGLTGGFLPLGATVATERVFRGFWSPAREKTLFHGHSYTANPLACAAALASLSLLTDACAVARRRIEDAHRGAARAFASHPRVRDARVLGTVLAFEVDEAAPDYRNPIGAVLGRFALERGVLLRPLGNTVYILPPYCSTMDDLATAYGVIRDFLDGR